jgi:hypothetical protein
MAVRPSRHLLHLIECDGPRMQERLILIEGRHRKDEDDIQARITAFFE